MWRRYSRGSKDIRRFRQDMGPDERREGFYGDQFDTMTQQSLEKIGKGHEAIEALLSGCELHQNVHIAIRAGLATSHRAK